MVLNKKNRILLGFGEVGARHPRLSESPASVCPNRARIGCGELSQQEENIGNLGKEGIVRLCERFIWRYFQENSPDTMHAELKIRTQPPQNSNSYVQNTPTNQAQSGPIPQGANRTMDGSCGWHFSKAHHSLRNIRKLQTS